MSLSFLKFKPIYKRFVWGGDSIKEVFSRADAPEYCAESWEISSCNDDISVVEDGEEAGKTLAELCMEYGRELLGSASPSTDSFPLLFKIIDANQNLSVQVHPSKADPDANPAEYKHEADHFLCVSESSAVYAGIKEECFDFDKFSEFARDNTSRINSVLNVLKPEVNETFYIPTGLVHALGAGNLVYEVQQNSNTTYRIYDWGRLGLNGNPRKMHLEEAIRSIDYTLPQPKLTKAVSVEGSPLNECIKTPYFSIYELGPEKEAADLDTRKESFHVLFVKEGSFTVASEEDKREIAKGESLLVPASLGAYRLKAISKGSRVLVTTL